MAVLVHPSGIWFFAVSLLAGLLGWFGSFLFFWQVITLLIDTKRFFYHARPWQLLFEGTTCIVLDPIRFFFDETDITWKPTTLEGPLCLIAEMIRAS